MKSFFFINDRNITFAKCNLHRRCGANRYGTMRFFLFTLIWLFNSSRKIYMSDSCQILVSEKYPPTTVPVHKFR